MSKELLIILQKCRKFLLEEKMKEDSPKRNTNKAGILIYFRHEDEISVLCVLQKESNNWGFPKGGQEEQDESLKEVALREFKEEVGDVLNIAEISIEGDNYIKESRLFIYPLELSKEYLESIVGEGITLDNHEEISQIKLRRLQDLMEESRVSKTTKKILVAFQKKLFGK